MPKFENWKDRLECCLEFPEPHWHPLIELYGRPALGRAYIVELRKFAESLDTLHNANVVHRDIKPQNIVINEDAEPLLIDFGLLHRSAPTSKLQGSVCTLDYMATQVCSHPIDHRSDICSLGGVLFRLLTEQLPFTGTPCEVLTDCPRIAQWKSEVNDVLTRVTKWRKIFDHTEEMLGLTINREDEISQDSLDVLDFPGSHDVEYGFHLLSTSVRALSRCGEISYAIPDRQGAFIAYMSKFLELSMLRPPSTSKINSTDFSLNLNVLFEVGLAATCAKPFVHMTTANEDSVLQVHDQCWSDCNQGVRPALNGGLLGTVVDEASQMSCVWTITPQSTTVLRSTATISLRLTEHCSANPLQIRLTRPPATRGEQTQSPFDKRRPVVSSSINHTRPSHSLGCSAPGVNAHTQSTYAFLALPANQPLSGCVNVLNRIRHEARTLCDEVPVQPVPRNMLCGVIHSNHSDPARNREVYERAWIEVCRAGLGRTLRTAMPIEDDSMAEWRAYTWAVDLARQLGIVVLLDECADLPACLVETKRSRVVFLYDGLHADERAWGLCHEIAHFVLNHECDSAYGLDWETLSRDQRGRVANQEKVADELACALCQILGARISERPAVFAGPTSTTEASAGDLELRHESVDLKRGCKMSHRPPNLL